MSKYNEQPDYWRECTQQEFARIFFQYIFHSSESRQMYYNTKGDKLEKPIQRVILFTIKYSGWEDLGVAIAYIDDEIRFFKYGSPKVWEARERAFAAQFAGDNS